MLHRLCGFLEVEVVGIEGAHPIQELFVPPLLFGLRNPGEAEVLLDVVVDDPVDFRGRHLQAVLEDAVQQKPLPVPLRLRSLEVH